MRKNNYFFCLIILLAMSLLLSGCSNAPSNNNGKVVVYTSVDQVFSSKILNQFERDTGIKVDALFDTESSKAVGLEKRLLAERDNPKADVFWNSEFMRTARLAEAGVFQNFKRDVTIYLNKKYYSPVGAWYGLGARNRVFIANKNLLKNNNYPSTLADIIDPKYKGKIAISTPYVGTASTHFAALYHKLGENKFENFLLGLKNNEVVTLAGNSAVKDAVGHGKFALGLVDSDDALVGIKQGLQIEMINYNQEPAGEGMFFVFQTLSLVKGGKNQANGIILINYLLRNKIERQLIEMNAVQINLLKGKTNGSNVKIWSVSPDIIKRSLTPSITLLRHYLD